MISASFLGEVQKQMNEDFKSQNPELFDLVFEIDGKKLYAHRYRLCLVSPTFKTRLSSQWSFKDEIIPIKYYSFEDFKELLTFIYSGDCEISDANIFVMIDLAEFYQIKHLSQFCDEFLSNMEFNLTNIFKICEISIKYSMIKLKELVHNYVERNFTRLIKSEGFLEAEKSVVQYLVVKEATIYTVTQEELFQAVYQWAEHQAVKSQKEPDYANLNLNEIIKLAITPFLPYFKFKTMKLEFLQLFVVQKDFLFSQDQIRDILENANSDVTVKVTNTRGESLYGTLPRDSPAFGHIKSLKNRPSDNSIYNSFIHWVTKFPLPSTPSLIHRKDEVAWYLIYFPDGDIGVITKNFPTGYLLAEMKPVDVGKSFTPTEACKIEMK